jgi:tight adherence protein B
VTPAAAAIAALLGSGLILVVIGFVLSSRRRRSELADILDLPFGPLGGGQAPSGDESGATESLIPPDALGKAGELLGRLDRRRQLASSLERARIPLRSGEYLLAAFVGSAVLGLVAVALAGHLIFALGGVLAGGLAASVIPRRRIEKRRQALEAQLPDAISLVAASLSAGHPFLRAIQMMTEEAEPPLADEFKTVIAETQLGRPLLDSLDRMGQRIDIRDLSWVVQAIRIQQKVGGKLADLLFTLVDFLRAREEVRREVDVLTAEGRLSALILSLLPAFILVAVQVVDPSYLTPLYRGWGLLWLGACVISVGIGVVTIMRMVRIDV